EEAAEVLVRIAFATRKRPTPADTVSAGTEPGPPSRLYADGAEITILAGGAARPPSPRSPTRGCSVSSCALRSSLGDLTSHGRPRPPGQDRRLKPTAFSFHRRPPRPSGRASAAASAAGGGRRPLRKPHRQASGSSYARVHAAARRPPAHRPSDVP